MKALYRFLIKSYIPPFLMTLLIGMFIFFIIFVFVYVDEIAGKGISSWNLTQLLFYSFLSNLPKSAPLAVLLSSIMTMGNLAERYEMAALKSAGLSLFKIMQPLIFFILIVSFGVYLFSNYTMPLINLKAGSLLWDVRESKPAFNINEGIYYGGLNDYRIRVEKKEKDGETVKGIYIADHSDHIGNNVQTIADSGTIKMTRDKNFLEIKIYNGVQYRHILNSEASYKTRPFVKMKFREQKVNIDLAELKMQTTPEDLFKNNYLMLTLSQLDNSLDSFDVRTVKIQNSLLSTITKNFAANSNIRSAEADSLHSPYISIPDYLKKYDKGGKNYLINRALEEVRSADQHIGSILENDLKNIHSDILRHTSEWHKKLTLPLACIVLFFVGAPLGAIVRRGGLGLPVVIATVMFIVFHIVTTLFEKSYLEGALGSFLGLWGATFIFLPIGIWLTYMAANDAAIFDKASYNKITSIFSKKKQN